MASNVNDASDIHVLAGNFDNDEADEFILAYRDLDNKLHIELYDTNEGLLPMLETQVADKTLADKNSVNEWGIFVHDLNNDRIDEVIIGFRPASPGQGVFAKVYELRAFFQPQSTETYR